MYKIVFFYNFVYRQVILVGSTTFVPNFENTDESVPSRNLKSYSKFKLFKRYLTWHFATPFYGNNEKKVLDNSAQ